MPITLSEFRRARRVGLRAYRGEDGPDEYDDDDDGGSMGGGAGPSGLDGPTGYGPGSAGNDNPSDEDSGANGANAIDDDEPFLSGDDDEAEACLAAGGWWDGARCVARGIEQTGGGGGPDGSTTTGTGEPGSAGGEAPEKCEEGDHWNWSTGQCEPDEEDRTNCPDGQVWDVQSERCMTVKTGSGGGGGRGGGGGGGGATKTSDKKTTTTSRYIAAGAGALAGSVVMGGASAATAVVMKSRNVGAIGVGGSVVGALVGGFLGQWLASGDEGLDVACCAACERAEPSAAARLMGARLRSGQGDAGRQAEAEDRAETGGSAVGLGPETRAAARAGIKLLNYATGWGKQAADCKPGEDPNDPECDGVQVITGARICKPGENPSSGCVPDRGDTSHRGAPATGAFPAAAERTAEVEEEAEQTRQSLAEYEQTKTEYERKRELEREASKRESERMYSVAGAVGAVAGSIGGAALASRLAPKNPALSVALTVASGAALATVGFSSVWSLDHMFDNIFGTTKP
jgi:hypothetical protein